MALLDTVLPGVCSACPCTESLQPSNAHMALQRPTFGQSCYAEHILFPITYTVQINIKLSIFKDINHNSLFLLIKISQLILQEGKFCIINLTI